MTLNDLLQIGIYLIATLLLVKPLGAYMAAVFSDEPHRVHRIGGPIERVFYRLSGIDAAEDMSWRRYAVAMLIFNVAGLLVVYVLQRTQQWLPLNPQGLGAVSADSSINTAISFASNTNWHDNVQSARALPPCCRGSQPASSSCPAPTAFPPATSSISPAFPAWSSTASPASTA